MLLSLSRARSGTFSLSPPVCLSVSPPVSVLPLSVSHSTPLSASHSPCLRHTATHSWEVLGSLSAWGMWRADLRPRPGDCFFGQHHLMLHALDFVPGKHVCGCACVSACVSAMCVCTCVCVCMCVRERVCLREREQQRGREYQGRGAEAETGDRHGDAKAPRRQTDTQRINSYVHTHRGSKVGNTTAANRRQGSSTAANTTVASASHHAS